MSKALKHPVRPAMAAAVARIGHNSSTPPHWLDQPPMQHQRVWPAVTYTMMGMQQQQGSQAVPPAPSPEAL